MIKSNIASTMFYVGLPSSLLSHDMLNLIVTGVIALLFELARTYIRNRKKK